jgi:hypothetical protein
VSRDDEQVWAELVESFHASPDDGTKQWPAAENVDADAPADEGDAGSASGAEAPATPSDERPVEHQRAPDPEEHYVPPPPPPLPSTDLITRLAWVGVLGTPLVFLVLVVFGQSVPGLVAAAGAAAFIGGFVILVSRLRGHDPYDPDDGAVL